jgi:hypothetical protein
MPTPATRSPPADFIVTPLMKISIGFCCVVVTWGWGPIAPSTLLARPLERVKMRKPSVRVWICFGGMKSTFDSSKSSIGSSSPGTGREGSLGSHLGSRWSSHDSTVSAHKWGFLQAFVNQSSWHGGQLQFAEGQ